MKEDYCLELTLMDCNQILSSLKKHHILVHLAFSKTTSSSNSMTIKLYNLIVSCSFGLKDAALVREDQKVFSNHSFYCSHLI